ncbi:MAG: hypothetical protein JJT76_01195 [Clostridiaceae bacterium]|nr:hypothetical protein [Clostridiaceae bacterium]
MKNEKILVICVLCCTFIFLVGCSAIFMEDSSVSGKELSVAEDHEILTYFREKYPDYTIIKCGEEDVTGNGFKDLIVIHNRNKEQNSMVVIMNNGDGDYGFSNELPAPAENQQIEFKDIDNKPPIEFIVSGSKGSNFGLAIFRMVEGEIVDLFADGFEDCC